MAVMSWPVAPPKDVYLVQQALFASGKALYVANRFEWKCQHVLSALTLADAIKGAEALHANEALDADEPVAARVERLFAEWSDRQMPVDAPRDTKQRSSLGMSESEAAVLRAARHARSEIMHHGADIGPLDYFDQARMNEFLRQLRKWVAELAAGDAIVTDWLHAIEERTPLPSYTHSDHIGAVDRFVFEHVPLEWLADGADAE
jgi:hypothetical protein